MLALGSKHYWSPTMLYQFFLKVVNWASWKAIDIKNLNKKGERNLLGGLENHKEGTKIFFQIINALKVMEIITWFR